MISYIHIYAYVCNERIYVYRYDNIVHQNEQTIQNIIENMNSCKSEIALLKQYVNEKLNILSSDTKKCLNTTHSLANNNNNNNNNSI